VIAPAALQARVEQALLLSGSADRELAAQIRDEGHRLAFLLNGLVRAARLYEIDNSALEAPARELAEVLRRLIDRLGVVNLVLVEDQAYVNDVRLRVRPAEQPVIDQLAAELGRHDTGGLTFHESLGGGALKKIARAIGDGPGDGTRSEHLGARLRALGDVEVTGRWRFRIGQDDAPGEKRHAEVVARTEAALRDTLHRLAARRMPNPLRVRRAVIDLVDGVRERPERAALAPFAGGGGTNERHLLSVCQLSLLIGRALGLGEAAQSDLGVTALLHDIGCLTRPDPQGHSLAGARILARQRGFSEAKVRRLLGVLEHHDDYLDMSRDDPSPSLFARIVRIAEHYDLLVGSEAARAPRIPPPAALARMWPQRGTRYDPILLALFVQQLGAYPPGTLLELSGDRMAVVIRPGTGREGFSRPVVKTIALGSGSAYEPSSPIDLVEVGDRAEVVQVLDPAHLEPGLRQSARNAIEAVLAA
jgi:hypothetical protein